MKRMIALALTACFFLTISLSACGGGSTPATNPPATGQPGTSSQPETSAPDQTDPPADSAEPSATEGPSETLSPTAGAPGDVPIPPLLDNGLELPIDGATGIASVCLPVWPACPEGNDGYKLDNFPDFVAPVNDWSGEEAAAQFPGCMAILMPGTCFEILEEQGDWWNISFVDPASLYGERFTNGWIEHRYCFINLPDVIPSILYNDTNSSGSIFVSCGKSIPGVTGKSFYNTYAYNVRLAKTAYIMPMLYSAARDVCAAQHKALADGNCLEIYQTFRPLDTQTAMAKALADMAEKDVDVKLGTSTPPWTVRMFLEDGVTEHQIGFGLDASLVHMNAVETKEVSGYPYLSCTVFERPDMPSAMHELSTAAVSQVSPSDTTLAPTMTDAAITLRGYFTSSGFTPQASAWWHFNNTAAQASTAAHPSDGDYFTEMLYSTACEAPSESSSTPISTPAPTDPPADPTAAAAPTPEPTKESVSATPRPDGIAYDPNYRLDVEIPPLLENCLELPVDGATGFASVNLPVWPACPENRDGYKLDFSGSLDTSSDNVSRFPGALAVLVPGTAFEIHEERGDWWLISFINPESVFGESLTEGWVEHRYCFINLPDVIPSILYNDTNGSRSIFTASGKDIPGVTGELFYSTQQFNVRLSRTEYIMPMLYSAARDLCAVQHKALAEGNCLEIYQAFRPLDTQVKVAQAMDALSKIDADVKAGITTAPWSFSDFIAAGTSAHQIGCALDVSLVRMKAAEIKTVQGLVHSYSYLSCTEYERYTMPTPMHELSMRAASQISPSDAELSPHMNAPAIALRSYFTDFGFIPSPAEWWHFENPSAQKAASFHPSKGDFFAEMCFSTVPL